MSWSTEIDYASLSVPVLLVILPFLIQKIAGEEDAVSPMKQNLEPLFLWILKGKTCPYVKKYVIQGAGHNFMFETPEICNALIYNFLISKCNIKEARFSCSFDCLDVKGGANKVGTI